MSRETKHERLTRAMMNQMSEHLFELKNLASNPATKELDVERWCQSVLKNCLGFTAIQKLTLGLAKFNLGNICEIVGKLLGEFYVMATSGHCMIFLLGMPPE